LSEAELLKQAEQYFEKNDFKTALLYLSKAAYISSNEKPILKMYNDIKTKYIDSIKSKQDIFALKEFDAKYGVLDLDDKDLTSLEQIDSLEYTRFGMLTLHLNKNKIQKISCLDNFSRLRTLELNENNLTEISGLEGLTNLRTLTLSDNNIVKITGLENLTKLTRLSIRSNNIDKIEGLENLTNLTSLGLSNNQINRIEGLEYLTKLNYLDLSNNQIKNIEGLENLSNLTELRLSGNQISQIEGLNELTELKELYLEANQIEKIDGIYHLLKLEYLDLGKNQISTMKDLREIKNLRKLVLSDNNLQTIDNLDLLPKLETIYLYGNQDLTNYFARAYDRKSKGKDSLTKLKEYCGLSNEELQKIGKERLRIEENVKKQVEISKGYHEFWHTSDYGRIKKLPERLNALLQLNKRGLCLYCGLTIPDYVNFEKKCEAEINKLMNEANKRLPHKAVDRNSGTYEREIEVREYEVRQDLIFGGSTGEWVTRKRKIKEKLKGRVKTFETENFPKLRGTLCKQCEAEFVLKARECFKHIKSKKYLDEIYKTMKKCHEEYMKLLEYMIKKRGF